MSINTTGLYGSNSVIINNDLFEDVETLKTDVITLTTSHLSVATEHDGRLDILETDNTSNEINISSNTTRIGDLETDVTSNTSRIVELETDVTSNTERIVDLEDHDSNHALRLDDVEGQIFNVVHEPNIHEDELLYYTPYPVPYLICRRWCICVTDQVG